MNYLNETVYVDTELRLNVPVGLLEDYVNLNETETAVRLYQRLNRNRASGQVLSIQECTEYAQRIRSKGELADQLKIEDRLGYLESKMLFNEANPVNYENWPVVSTWDKYQHDPFFVSRARTEMKSELDELYSVMLEKSHRLLQHTYRVGYDIDTGHKVAVQFELKPETITGVGDPKFTPMKNGQTAEDIKKLHDDAIPEVQSTIKRYGHIDHVTSPLKVTTIFHRNGKQLSSVRMVPMFSNDMPDFFQKVLDLAEKQIPEIRTKYPKPDDFFASGEFPKFFVAVARTYKFSQVENYHISRSDQDLQGKDMYKTTKLFWDQGKFTSFQFSPKLRGYAPVNTDPEGEKKKYNLNNSPSKGNLPSKITPASYKSYITKAEGQLQKAKELAAKVTDESKRKLILDNITAIQKDIDDFKKLPSDTAPGNVIGWIERTKEMIHRHVYKLLQEASSGNGK